MYDLEKQTKQFAGSMSGGQKQRLALACATYIHRSCYFLMSLLPPWILRIEESSGSDCLTFVTAGTTILVSTHYMDEAERCHALAILEEGNKRADGSPQQLMEAMPAKVVEVSGDNLRRLKQNLIQHPDIMSAAQIGAHLRVLVKQKVANPLRFISQLSDGRVAVLARPVLKMCLSLVLVVVMWIRIYAVFYKRVKTTLPR
ncbi:hypothetical protein PEC18_00045 [Paucibacter sp. O1-1]|nr:hypothetical protein [Paucibacter sp. O1-1]MDA3824321.1 hypothetical protein [Paucibacter sp. O1-1]